MSFGPIKKESRGSRVHSCCILPWSRSHSLGGPFTSTSLEVRLSCPRSLSLLESCKYGKFKTQETFAKTSRSHSDFLRIPCFLPLPMRPKGQLLATLYEFGTWAISDLSKATGAFGDWQGMHTKVAFRWPKSGMDCEWIKIMTREKYQKLW